MPISCSTSDLITAAACLKCIPRGMQREVMIYILAQLAGLPTDPGSLINASNCMKCIPSGMQDEVITYLLCQLAGGVTPTVDCAMLTGTGNPTGVTTPQFSGQLYLDSGSGTYYRSTGLTSADWVAISGGASILITTPPGNEQQYGVSSIGEVPGVTELVWNAITTCSGLDVEFSSILTSVSCPNLISVDPTGTQNGSINLDNNSALLSADFPVLVSIKGSFSGQNLLSLITLNIPVLTSVGKGFNYNGSPTGLVSFSAPSLTIVGQDMQVQGDVLTTVNLPQWVPTDGTIINFSFSALNSASVEQILRRCVLAGVTTCTIDLSSGTNAGVASLNAQGQADVVTLGSQLTINP